MGRKRRLARWHCTACARDVEAVMPLGNLFRRVATQLDDLWRNATSPLSSESGFLSRQFTARLSESHWRILPACYLRPSTPFNEPAIYLVAVRERRVADDVICATLDLYHCETSFPQTPHFNLNPANSFTELEKELTNKIIRTMMLKKWPK